MTAKLSRWMASITVLVIGAAALLAVRPSWPAVIAIAAVELFLAWWYSPLRHGSGPPDAEARRRAAAEGAVVIYWRPGCMFCSRLRRSLGPLRRQALWVNIWADADAAEYVRGVNGGDETVPTVLVGTDAVWTNPPPRQVRDALLRRPAH